MNIPIFLSHATPHTHVQENFLAKIKQLLKEKGIECISVKSSDINSTNAIGAIIDKMGQCFGFIAVAYERRMIYSATEKRNADVEKMKILSRTDVKETTPYIHIETAIACTKSLPIFILKENGLLEEGMLERNRIGITGPYFDLSEEAYFESEEFCQNLDAFVSEVKKFYTSKKEFYHNR